MQKIPIQNLTYKKHTNARKQIKQTFFKHLTQMRVISNLGLSAYRFLRKQHLPYTKTKIKKSHSHIIKSVEPQYEYKLINPELANVSLPHQQIIS